MSRESVKKFYELAETDKEFAQKLASLDSEMSLEASDLANLKAIVNEKIIPLAKEKGLDFTAEEMVDFANEKYMQLSKDDLLDVSGGVSPKAAGLALSSVLMLSLGSAAAINLMNNNHDNVSNVVSDSGPSTSKSESEAEIEDEEALKKSLDEMLKKSPKGADKKANTEDIEKELDKLFKGGKLGGGGAFRPGKGRTAGKNMLNRTVGKKGTSDVDFDKFLKELDNELAKEAATSQATKPKAATSEVSNFDFDNLLEEINHEAAPAPISKGTPKKIEKTKEQVEAEKKQAQQQVDKRLADFKAKFENSFKEKFKTQCDDEDLTAFVNDYLATPGNLDGAMVDGETTVKFYQNFSGGSVHDSVNVLDFAKKLNAALPKMQYKAVSRGITTPWKDIMSHVMGALQEAKYDLSKFDLNAMKKLQDDINWICGAMKASNGTYYLGASRLAGGDFRSKYGWDTKKPTLENKELEFLKALKDSLYNKDDEKVQAALKALSGDEMKEDPVKKPDASGEDQARKQREEAERLQRQADKRANDFKEALIEDFKESDLTKVDDKALRLYAENYLKTHDNEKDMDYVDMTVVFRASGSDGYTATSSLDVLDVLREVNNALPEKDAPFIFENQKAAQQLVDDFASAFKLTVENAFKFDDVKTQLSEAELQQFVRKTTGVVKSDPSMQKTAIVGSNSVTFFTKGQLKNGANADASSAVNVLELAKELNEKLPKAVEETKEKPVEKPAAGATVTTAEELRKQAEKQKQDAEAKLTEKFKEKIKANNDMELNEANLNKLINKTLDNYKKESKENITVNEKKGTLTFTAKGTISGTFVRTKGGVGSATLNVRGLFTKLNNEAKKVHDAAMKKKIEEKKKAVEQEKVGWFTSNEFEFVTRDDLSNTVKQFESELKQDIKKAFESKIREIYSAQCKVAKIKFDASQGVPTAVAAKIANDLTEEQKKEIINSVMKEEIVPLTLKGETNKYFGILNYETAPLNDQIKVKVTGKTEVLREDALGGLAKHLLNRLELQETVINVRNEIDSLVGNYKLMYKDVVGGTVVGKYADEEVDDLYNFLVKNKLIENGMAVHSVLDRIKDSDKKQFKEDVQHIAGNIHGEEGSYTLKGDWKTYKGVAQEKLKAIKDLARQLK